MTTDTTVITEKLIGIAHSPVVLSQSPKSSIRSSSG